MYTLHTTQHNNIVTAFGCVEFSFLLMFEVVQDPARCRMLLQQIVVYYCNTTGAVSGGEGCREPRTTAPVRGAHLYKMHLNFL